MGFKKQIAQLFGMSVADIEAAIESDKQINIESVTIFTDSELENNNLKVKTTAEKEILKSVSTEIGIEFSKVEGLKSVITEKFSDADSKKEIENLRGQLTAKETSLAELDAKFSEMKSQNSFLTKTQKVAEIIPDGYTVDRSMLSDIIMNRKDIGVDESGALAYLNSDGTVRLDKKNQVERPTKEEVSKFLDEKGFVKAQSGTDKKDDKGAGNQNRVIDSKFANINSLKDLEAYAKENNIESNSPEFRQLVTDVYAELPDIK